MTAKEVACDFAGLMAMPVLISGLAEEMIANL